MKVKALNRTKASTTRSTPSDLRPIHKNLNPSSHPLPRAREYTRAVTAAKLDRMFASPFVGELKGGHVDGVNCLSVSRTNLLPVVSGGVDGTVRIWDLQSRSMVKNLEAHSRCVSGVVFGFGGMFYSCGEEGLIKAWNCFPKRGYLLHNDDGESYDGNDDDDDGESDEDSRGYAKKPSSSNGNGNRGSTRTSSTSTTTTTTTTTFKDNNFKDEEESPYGPFNTYRLPSIRSSSHNNNSVAFHSIDHHWAISQFASASSDSAIHLWDPNRNNSPVTSFTNLWGSDDTVTTVRYNPAETNLIAHCSNDRGIGLHDTRTASALSKTILGMKSNCLEWNPMEPYMFVVGNEDYNAYTFDMRKLSRPTGMYKGHVGAVMSVSWSPTGTEFVSGSYDKTLRILKELCNNQPLRDISLDKAIRIEVSSVHVSTS